MTTEIQFLGTPIPSVSSAGLDHIEWSWEPVENALAYQVQVADLTSGFDGAETELITATTKRVTAEPGIVKYIRVRACSGTPVSPVVSEWSVAVIGKKGQPGLVFSTVIGAGERDDEGACVRFPICEKHGAYVVSNNMGLEIRENGPSIEVNMEIMMANENVRQYLAAQVARSARCSECSKKA